MEVVALHFGTRDGVGDVNGVQGVRRERIIFATVARIAERMDAHFGVEYQFAVRSIIDERVNVRQIRLRIELDQRRVAVAGGLNDCRGCKQCRRRQCGASRPLEGIRYEGGVAVSARSLVFFHVGMVSKYWV